MSANGATSHRDRQPQRTCCLATSPGRGAIATVLAEGPGVAGAIGPLFRPVGSAPADDLPLRWIVFGKWAGGAGSEELIVCRTAAERIEIHCHGGKVAARAVMQGLAEVGFREIAWHASLIANDGDPIRAAAWAALARARTERTAAILLQQYHGALRTAIARIIRSARMGGGDETERRLEQLESRAELGRHLTVPWRVVLAGPSNVGKSSLANALLGYRRAIVFDRSGTTRDAVTATTALDGWPVELIDTAGFPDEPSGNALEQSSTAQTLRKLEKADAVVWVFQAGLHEPERALASIEACRPAEGSRNLIVFNKCDLVEAPDDAWLPGLATSATEGTGVAEIALRIANALVPTAPNPRAAVPFTAQHRRAVRDARAAVSQGDLKAAARRLDVLLGGVHDDIIYR